jgi:trans-aconitate methyltransferase
MVIVGWLYQLFSAPKILDVGCGTGTLAHYLQLLPGASYTGIDLSSEAVSRATARGLANARFFRGSMEEWAPPEQYDAIVFGQSLYYASDPLAVLRRYSSSLTEQGAFIVTIWQAGNYRLMWDTIERQFSTVACATVITPPGAANDLRVLRTRAQISGTADTFERA